MKRLVVAAAILAMLVAMLVALSTVETHRIGMQETCSLLANSPSGESVTRRMLSAYYGLTRKPDEVIELDDGRTRIVYYESSYGQDDSRHWSGYVLWYFFPLVPLLYPDGHHRTEYVIANGIVTSCTTYFHQTLGTPKFHI